MAGELEALEQGYKASLRQLRTLLDAQARLLEVAEQTAAETRAELERLAEALCPGLVDDLRKGDPLGLSQVTARALADAVVRDVQRRLSRLGVAEVAGQSVQELYEQATAEVARLREEVARLEGELAEARRRGEQAELRTAVLQQTLEDAQRRLGLTPGAPVVPEAETVAPVPAQPALIPEEPAPSRGAEEATLAPVPPEQLPEWVREWQRKRQQYERDLALLRVLAETGVARRKDAAGLFAARLGLKPSGGGVGRVFQRCAQLGLIELIEAQSGVRGKTTHHLLRLTERGRDACRLLLGQEPVPSQTTELLARHKSPAHALLNLEAADLLREAGYEVDLFPGAVKLPEGRLFAPDLAASRQGRTLYVEVERETRKSLDERDRKWGNYYDATGGEFYVVVPDRSALNAIKSEILFWAGQRKLVLWMTSVSDAKGKKGDAVWLFKRGEPR